jgi:hypothetical protein
MRENEYQSKLIKKIKNRFPGAIILKNDSSYKQGIPDLTVLWKDKWAALETKRSKDAPHRPNQDYYVDMMNKMSYSSFIFPENEQEVLDAMENTFSGISSRRTRNVRSK